MPVLTLEQLPQPAQRIIPALDQDTWPEATASLLDIGNRISIGKVNSLADRHMDLAVKKLAGLGLLTMLDFKTLDIDMTMRKRTRQQTLAGASLLTVHAQNTVNALKDAIKGAEDALVIDPKLVRPLILGVTVLTTINDKDRDKGNNPIETCTSIYGASRMTKVRDFAYHAVDAGLDGLVCSPHEAEMLKNDPRTAHMLLVIPAIRPPYAINPDEQNIAATPHVAMDAGADLLVIGRPITEAASYGLTGGEAVDLIVENMGMAA